ncbi:MAG: mevalonate kinase [Oligoflexales bacterium]
MAELDSNTEASPSTSHPKPAHGSACGKAIIVGEHAVVYGSRAVAIPLKKMRMTLELTPHIQGNRPISLKLGGKELSHRISDVIKDAIQALRVYPFSLAIQGKSSLPFGAGLGASATLCIAILRAIAASVGMKLTQDRLSVLGNILERRFHGSPSGLDTAVVAFEECITFTKNGPITAIDLPDNAGNPRWEFALVDSGVRASTLSMINVARPYFSGTKADERIQKFDNLAQIVGSGISALDYLAVAEAMNEASLLLSAAGVVTHQLKEIMKTCLKTGLLAAKPTGAGGGGVVLGLLSPHKSAEQLAKLRDLFGVQNVYSVTV